MDLWLFSWRCVILFLCFSIKGCPLLPADCMDIIPLGYLTAEPATLVLMGSNLTVYCHVFRCQQGSKMYLELNGQKVNPLKKLNCTTTMFLLPRIWKSQSSVLCKMKSNQLSALQIISGLDLHAGFPPDKPADISCETTKTSEWINCTLNRGRETHLRTLYNISVNRENERLLGLIQDGEEISIPRVILDKNTKYILTATAYNHFGASQSDAFVFSLEDIVIPDTPHIIKMEFMNDSTSAILHWKTSETLKPLRPQIRLRANNNTWEQREGAELSQGLIQVEELRPLTEYELQIQACTSLSGQTHTSSRGLKSSQRSLCSRWSPSVRKISPGKGPSQPLHVWRTLGRLGNHGLRNVTVLWKPLSSEDYFGEMLRYRILLDNGQEVNCAAASSQCSVQATAEVQALSVTAETSYGASPPAFVDLRHAGVSGSFLEEFPLSSDDSSVHVSWSSAAGKALLYFVIEWISMPARGLQWKKVAKDQKNTTITGLIPGVRYQLSLYTVTTRGVSAPASKQTYSREQKPSSAPVLRTLIHEAKQILVRWDELPLHQQRGFITHYTVYLKTLDPNSAELKVTVSGSDQREMRLDHPEGALYLQLTASNSAGEGPRGNQIFSQPLASDVGLVIVIVFIFTIFTAVLANLMCWSCVRKRIKQKCIAWGPDWLMDNLPKPGHSNAIRLLEDNRNETLFSSTYNDPPLSPISVLSEEERNEVYPAIHVEESQFGSEQPSFSISDTRTVQFEHIDYKPQIAHLVPCEVEVNGADWEQRDVPESTEDDRLLVGFEGLLGDLLSHIDVDNSDMSHWVTLTSIGDLLRPTTAEPSILKGLSLQGMNGKEEDMENGVPSVDLQQDQKNTLDSDDPCSSLCSVNIGLNSGYFPQVASLSVVTLDR